MALARGRRRPEAMNYWPGFVDALSTLLLVLIFLLSVFVMAQYFLSRDVGGKDAALARLNQADRGIDLAPVAGKRRQGRGPANLAALSATLESDAAGARRARGRRAGAAAENLDAEKQLSARAQAQRRSPQPADRRLAQPARRDAGGAVAQEARTRKTRRASPISARASMSLWRRRCRNSRAIAPTSSAGCAKFLASGRASKWWATVSCCRPKCCSKAGRPALTPEGKTEMDKILCGAGRSREGNPAGNSLGSAGRRPYRQAADRVVAIQLELGSFRGERHRRRAISARQGLSRRSICWPAPLANSSRSTRATAKTPCAATAGSN